MPKNYVIVTSHRSEVSNVPSYNVGVVENYLFENVTETFCLGAIFTCSIYDIAVTCYFGGFLTHNNYDVAIAPNYDINMMSLPHHMLGSEGAEH